jgi:hypothetical protein
MYLNVSYISADIKQTLAVFIDIDLQITYIFRNIAYVSFDRAENDATLFEIG